MKKITFIIILGLFIFSVKMSFGAEQICTPYTTRCGIKDGVECLYKCNSNGRVETSDTCCLYSCTNGVCDSNWVTSTYSKSTDCSKIGGLCGDFNSTPSSGATCTVGGRAPGSIFTGKCGGDSTVKCCSPTDAVSCDDACIADYNPCVGADCFKNGASWGTLYNQVCTCRAVCDISCAAGWSFGTCNGAANCTQEASHCNADCSNSDYCYQIIAPDTQCVCGSNTCSGTPISDNGYCAPGACGTGTIVADCSNSDSYAFGVEYASSNGCGTCVGTMDSAPSGGTLVIKNVNNTVVVADSNNRNHICENTFANTANPDIARFVVTYTDAQSGNDINQIRLQIGSKIFTSSTLTVSGNEAIAIFDVSMSLVNSTTLENISISASDSHTFTGSVTDFADANINRQFKFWDCKVPVSGTGYDGSENGSDCNDPNSYIKTISNSYDLKMHNVPPETSGDKTMTVNTPNYYSDNSNNLIWGKNYNFILSNIESPAPVSLRVNKINNNCISAFVTLDASNVDPYISSIGITLDFSLVLNQDPWWQANGGGAISNNQVNNRVPITCVTDNCKMSLNSLVSGQAVNNTGKSINNGSQTWYYENSSAKLANLKNNYSYFFDQYYVKNKIGTILTTGDRSISEIGKTGVYFVDGNLTIDRNKAIGAGEFLMIIVKGDITVTQDVSQIDGILVANNIGASGVSDSQLLFNGSLFASNKIDFSRGYSTKVANNLSPAVVVKYNPELIFKLPGAVAKVLSNFRWGN